MAVALVILYEPQVPPILTVAEVAKPPPFRLVPFMVFTILDWAVQVVPDRVSGLWPLVLAVV